jgi:hypothetical protein
VWLRWALAVAAALYFLGLFVYSTELASVPQRPVIKPIAFFFEAAGLFPNADRFAIEARLEGWSCVRRRWEKLDPRPYFPIEADNKESRFHRLVGFFTKSTSANERKVMNALDDYIVARHTDDDGVTGAIGGIRVYRVLRDLPAPGEPTARYEYDPLAPLRPDEQRREVYNATKDRRAQHCGGAR